MEKTLDEEALGTIIGKPGGGGCLGCANRCDPRQDHGLECLQERLTQECGERQVADLRLRDEIMELVRKLTAWCEDAHQEVKNRLEALEHQLVVLEEACKRLNGAPPQEEAARLAEMFKELWARTVALEKRHLSHREEASVQRQQTQELVGNLRAELAEHQELAGQKHVEHSAERDKLHQRLQEQLNVHQDEMESKIRAHMGERLRSQGLSAGGASDRRAAGPWDVELEDKASTVADTDCAGDDLETALGRLEALEARVDALASRPAPRAPPKRRSGGLFGRCCTSASRGPDG